jgi:hypothetical protein
VTNVGPGSSGVEQGIENPRVGGSNPPPGTIFFSQTVEIKRIDAIFRFYIHLNIHLFRADTA